MCKKENIEIKERNFRKINDYEAIYNGVVAYGETALEAIENAKKKWQLVQEVELGKR